MEDLYVSALRALCKREGDHKRVADVARVSAENLWQILNGIALPSGNPRGVGPGLRGKLTKAYPDWLAGAADQTTSNVTPTHVRRRVPIISWVKAGHWGDVHDQFQPGEADEWADAYDTQPGDQSFALRVTGDSMTSPHPGERSFPDGTVIIVDPARAATAGDYVVAKDVNTQQATFKRLVHDAGRWFLKPLNPAYPMLEIDDPGVRVIGRVIEYQTKGKL